LPDNFLTNVFNAMVSSEDESVWHRSLYILSDYDEKVKHPEALKYLNKISSLSNSKEVRVLA